jgi:hypothetical protein
LAVDPFFGKLYWSTLLGPDSPPEIAVWRANLDGSSGGSAFYDHTGYNGLTLAIDYAHRTLYWAESTATTGLFRYSTDGAGSALLLIDDYPRNIATDPRDGYLYWSNPTALRRASLDGAGPEDIVTGQVWGADVYVCP